MPGPESIPDISVIAPLWNEQDNVGPLAEQVFAVFEKERRPIELILVDDASTDRTWEEILKAQRADSRVRAIRHARNSGQSAALWTGFSASRAGIIATLDGDLQNDPADLPRLLALLEEGGYRAVSGWRRQRQEQFLQRVLPSQAANWLIAQVTGVPSRDNGCGLKAYRAEVVKGVYLPHGLHRFMPAVFGVRAREFAQIEVTDRRRRAGRSHYGLSRSFAVLRDLMVIPYLLRDPQRALHGMEALVGAVWLLGLGALLLLMPHHEGTGLLLGVVAGLLLAYAHGVRANLQRWLRAQSEKTFRIRGAGRRLAPTTEAARTRARVRS